VLAVLVLAVVNVTGQRLVTDCLCLTRSLVLVKQQCHNSNATSLKPLGTLPCRYTPEKKPN